MDQFSRGGGFLPNKNLTWLTATLEIANKQWGSGVKGRLNEWEWVGYRMI